MTPDSKHFFLVMLCVFAGCAADPADRGNLYTYVDAQGNLVTLDKPVDESQRAAERPVDGPDGEQYQTDEQVQQLLEERDRNRFVTYPGPDGQLVEEPVDLVAEREHSAAQAPGYQEVQAPAFIERMLGLRADCCAHTLEQAAVLAATKERRLTIADSEQTLALDTATPGETLKLVGEVVTLRLRGYIGKSGKFQFPGIIFLDQSGTPVLAVDRPFQRRYPETWYRHAYFEGHVEVPENARFAAFYLPYAAREGDSGVVMLPAELEHYDPAPALTGDLTVYGATAR